MSKPSLPLPRLVATPSGQILEVDSRPFLMRAGELQNSSFSSAAYMSEQWANLVALGLNTVLGAVTWEAIEPEEGRFDFTELHAVLAGARSHGLRVVLLWFGSYKNGMSTYVPGWVKRDVGRFSRVKIRKGKENEDGLKMIEVLSPFDERCWQADARAFEQLMRHLAEVDTRRTVIMVQVENEPGILGDSRDRSHLAEEAIAQPVPTSLLQGLQARPRPNPHTQARFPGLSGLDGGSHTWTEVFGDDADEALMAHAISSYVARVATAGRDAYPLPLYTNCWVNCDVESALDLEGIPVQPGQASAAGGGAGAGDYPSGGPVPHVFDIWKVNTAGVIDFLSPDVYLQKLEWVAETYAEVHLPRGDAQPLFIPECRRDAFHARRVLYAYATHGALGMSPFGVDTMRVGDEDTVAWTKTFDLLRSITPEILLARQRADTMFGFYFDEIDREIPVAPEEWTHTFGDWRLSVTRAHVFGRPGPGSGMIIWKGDDRFLLCGWGFNVTFSSAHSDVAFAGILSVRELVPTETQGGERVLEPGRALNGDETRSGDCVIMPNDEPDYGGFPIAVTIPARTYIAECSVYAVQGE